MLVARVVKPVLVYLWPRQWSVLFPRFGAIKGCSHSEPVSGKAESPQGAERPAGARGCGCLLWTHGQISSRGVRPQNSHHPAMRVEEENPGALSSQGEELINVSRLPETFSLSCKSGRYSDISVSLSGMDKTSLSIISGQLGFQILLFPPCVAL